MSPPEQPRPKGGFNQRPVQPRINPTQWEYPPQRDLFFQSDGYLPGTTTYSGSFSPSPLTASSNTVTVNPVVSYDAASVMKTFKEAER